jgi:hypothetical protein
VPEDEREVRDEVNRIMSMDAADAAAADDDNELPTADENDEDAEDAATPDDAEMKE